MARDKPALPARWAFVVQLHMEAQVECGHFKGRVEHLVSHQAAHFESLEELLAFMVQMVTKPRDRQGDDSGRHDGPKEGMRSWPDERNIP